MGGGDAAPQIGNRGRDIEFSTILIGVDGNPFLAFRFFGGKIHACSFGSLGSLILVGWKEFSFTIVGVIRYVISSI